MNKHIRENSIAGKIREILKKGKPVCIHEVALELGNGISEKDVSSLLSYLVTTGYATKTLERASCLYSDKKHSFYNYARNEEMIERGNKKVIDMLNTEINTLKGELVNRDKVVRSDKFAETQKIKMENASLKEQLMNEKVRTKMLAGLLFDLLKER